MKYMYSHRKHWFLSIDRSIRHLYSQEKAPATLSPCIRLYSFGWGSEELFSARLHLDSEDLGTSSLRSMIRIKAIEFAPNDLSVTCLAARAQGGVYWVLRESLYFF